VTQGLQISHPDKTLPVPLDIQDWVKRTPYRTLISKLMYIAIGTRPDIAYAVGRLASVLDCYRPEHWEARIRVVRYLKGTRLLSLELGGQSVAQLIGHSNSDYANCSETSGSVGGYYFLLGSGAISWSSRKNRTVANSSCYAEYIALHGTTHEAIFLRQLLEGLHFLPSHPTPILCNNDAASILAMDHVWHMRTKHMRVKFHYIRQQVTDGEIRVEQVHLADNIADILTKSLGKMDFQRLRYKLGLRGPSGDMKPAGTLGFGPSTVRGYDEPA
jgi:hypothetical protein